MYVSRIFIYGPNSCFLLRIPVIIRQTLHSPLQTAFLYITKDLILVRTYEILPLQWCIQHDIQSFTIFYSTTTWPKFQTFMLAQLRLYFSYKIFSCSGKNPFLYVRSSWLKQHFNWKLKIINIFNIYVSIKCNHSFNWG